VLRSFPFFKPCIPFQRSWPPDGLGWLHEVKLDGWRGQLHRCDGAVRLYSKRGNDLGFRFPDLVRSAAGLPVGDVILDGEITALDRHGLPNVEALQRADRDYPRTFWAFDLLRIGKCDLRGVPLEERKAKLADLLGGTDSDHVRYSESFEDAQALLHAAMGLGLEGVVSKKCSSAYRSGPCHSWVKVKTVQWRDANRERWKLFERHG
jgi:bifunctional non-homologous end joining protein LigD